MYNILCIIIALYTTHNIHTHARIYTQALYTCIIQYYIYKNRHGATSTGALSTRAFIIKKKINNMIIVKAH